MVTTNQSNTIWIPNLQTNTNKRKLDYQTPTVTLTHPSSTSMSADVHICQLPNKSSHAIMHNARHSMFLPSFSLWQFPAIQTFIYLPWCLYKFSGKHVFAQQNTHRRTTTAWTSSHHCRPVAYPVGEQEGATAPKSVAYNFYITFSKLLRISFCAQIHYNTIVYWLFHI